MSANVLVVSHNPFSSQQNNGKTLESFFSDWQKDSIAQLYLSPEAPDFNFCSNYYRITDYDVLSNLLNNTTAGNIINEEYKAYEINNLNKIVGNYYTTQRRNRERKGIRKFLHTLFEKRCPTAVLGRTIIWRKSQWNNDRLKQWINNFKPDVLFFQPSAYSFAYDIALEICYEYNLPMIIEPTDDYTYIQYPFSICEMINRKIYMKKFKEAILYSNNVVAISPYMAKEYKRRFGGDYTVLLNSTDELKHVADTSNKEVIKFVYAGNVGLNRWKVLCNIGKSLQSIGKKLNLQVKLFIYTPSYVEKKVLDAFNEIDPIVYCGSISKEELVVIFRESDYLIHVESFSPKIKKITRLSISTKIPEYLATHRCIYAVGPSDIASMKYLADNRVAHITNSNTISTIEEDITALLTDKKLSNDYITNANTLFSSNHTIKSTTKKINKIIHATCNQP